MSGTVSLRITLRYKDLDEFVARYAENVSSAGLFLRTRAPKPTGTRIRFELLLADGAKAFAGEGVVVAVRTDDKPGMGIRFHQLDPGSDELMKRIVGAHGEGPLAPAPLGIARTLGRAVDTWAPPSRSLPQDWSRPSWSAPAPEPERADPARREARRPTSLLRPWAQRATPEPDPAPAAPSPAPARPSLAPPPRPAAASPARDDVDFSSVLELLAKGADLGGASSIVRAERVATSQLGARLPDDAALSALTEAGGSARRAVPHAAPEPSGSALLARPPTGAATDPAREDASIRTAPSDAALGIVEAARSADTPRREAEPPVASPWVVDPVRAALPATDLAAEDATLLASAEVEPLEVEPLESVPPESVPPESVPPESVPPESVQSLAPADGDGVATMRVEAGADLAPTPMALGHQTEPAPPSVEPESSPASLATEPSPPVDGGASMAPEALRPSEVAGADLAPISGVDGTWDALVAPELEAAPPAAEASVDEGGGERGSALDLRVEADTPAHDAPTHDAPAHDAPTHDAPAHEAPAHDTPAHDAPTHDAPAHEAPAHEAEAPIALEPAGVPATADAEARPLDVPVSPSPESADAPETFDVDVSGFDDRSPGQDLGLRPGVLADADALRAAGLVPFDELEGIPPTSTLARVPSASPPRPVAAAWAPPREATLEPEGGVPRRPTLELVPFAELTPSDADVGPLLEVGALAGAIDAQLAAISEIQAASLVSSEVVAPQAAEAPPLGDPWVPSVQVVPLGAADVDFDRWRRTAPQAVVDPAFLDDARERDAEASDAPASAPHDGTSSSEGSSSPEGPAEEHALDADADDVRPPPFAAMLEATLAPAPPPMRGPEVRGFDTARVDLLAGWDPVDERPAPLNEATQRIAVELSVGPREEAPPNLGTGLGAEPDPDLDPATTRIALTTTAQLGPHDAAPIDAPPIDGAQLDAAPVDAPPVEVAAVGAEAAPDAPAWTPPDRGGGEDLEARGEASAPLADLDAAFEATFSIAPPPAAPSAEAELEPAWPVRAVAIATQEVILPPLETLRASAPPASASVPGVPDGATEMAAAAQLPADPPLELTSGARWADAVAPVAEPAPRVEPSFAALLAEAAPAAPSSPAAPPLDADLALDTVSRWQLAFDASTEMLGTSSAPLPAQVPAEQRSTRISVRGLDASALPAAAEPPHAPSSAAASGSAGAVEPPLERAASSPQLGVTDAAEVPRVDAPAAGLDGSSPQVSRPLASEPPIPLPPSRATTADIVPPIVLGAPLAPVAPAARLPSMPGLGEGGVEALRDAEPTTRIRAPAPVEGPRTAASEPGPRVTSQTGTSRAGSLEPAARLPSNVGAERAPLPRPGSASTPPRRANSGITVGPVTSNLDAPIVAPSVAYDAPPTGEIELPRRRSLGGPARDALALDLSGELRVARAAAGQVEVVALQPGASRRVAVGLGPDGAVLAGADLDDAPPSRVLALREVLGRLAEPPDARRAITLDGEQVDTLELLRIGLGGLLRQHERTFGAGRPAVVLTVPRALDPDAEELVVRAGGAAGLDVRGLVPELLALARGLGVERPGVESALVVEVSSSGATLAVLRRGRDGLAVAAQVERESVSIARADALVREGLGDTDEALTREVLARARSELRRESVVTLRLPSGEVRLSRARLQQLLEPLLVELAQATREVLGAAGVHPKVLGTTVLVGELGAPGAQVVGNVVGREVVVAGDVEDARLRGLLRLADAKVSSRPQQLEQDIGVALPGGRFHVLIARGSSLPAKVSRKHATVRDQQAEFELTFYEGTSETVQGATLLGALMLGPLPKAPRGAVEVEVTLAVDADAVLSVVFAEPKSGLRRRLSAATRATPAERRVEMSARAAVEDLSEQRAKPKTGLWDRLLGRR